jgi:hypothetical protein
MILVLALGLVVDLIVFGLAERRLRTQGSSAQVARRGRRGRVGDGALGMGEQRTFAGLRAIQWSIVTGDPAPGQTASAIVRTVRGEAMPGSIVIFHANGRGHGTAEALREIVPVLRDKGYTFVTVGELLDRSDDVVATHECYELRPGDNLRYDHLLRPGRAVSGGPSRGTRGGVPEAIPPPD